MRLRRLCLAVLASAVSLLAACAVPEKTDTEKDKVAAVPRDCEPQTGTRVPASCTKRGGVSSGSGSVQTMERPSRVEMR
ncbi:MAG TPA: hypothetical protein VGQ91_11540 [Ideonella sp.]|jgi:hypothetical protein|nr:hypothetical protein [Ideonella sp.]